MGEKEGYFANACHDRSGVLVSAEPSFLKAGYRCNLGTRATTKLQAQEIRSGGGEYRGVKNRQPKRGRGIIRRGWKKGEEGEKGNEKSEKDEAR